MTDDAAVRPRATHFREPSSSIPTRGGLGVRIDNQKDAIFYMQGITFPTDPTKGCLFHLGGSVGLWAGINDNNQFEVFVRNVGWRLTSQNFPKDGQKHTVLIYIKAGIKGPGEVTLEQGAIRAYIDCEEIVLGGKYFDPLPSNKFFFDSNSGSYLLASPNGQSV
eukprot:1428397-Rhodomonas_salina.1